MKFEKSFPESVHIHFKRNYDMKKNLNKISDNLPDMGTGYGTAVVSYDDLLKVCETLLSVSRLAPVYTNKTIMDLLDINTTTLKKYRDQGLLGYSRIDDKFFYSAKDVYAFLKNTHYDPFAC